jgi:antitoxin Xre/MbcA/ParS-like protein
MALRCLVVIQERSMENLVMERVAPDRQAVGLKAFARIADAWSLTLREAAMLADMSESTWKRAKRPGFAGDLTHDQMLRLSALVGLYKSLELYFNEPISRQWVKLPNKGPEFDGARPVDAMIAGGLPKILRVRGYLDALRGGA